MRSVLPLVGAVLALPLAALAAAPAAAASLSTHVLDLARGTGGTGVPVVLERQAAASWERVATATTDANGRVRDFPAAPEVAPGIYRLRFDMTAYPAPGSQPFFPEIVVVFRVGEAAHYHVPVVVSPYGYSTYRGN